MDSKQNKKVLITGGTAGIGRAIALLLAEAGYHVTLIGRDYEKLQDLLTDYNKLERRGTLNGLIADLTDERAIEKILQEYLDDYGCPDIFINNAGLPYNGVMDEQGDSLAYLVKTNLWAYMHLAGKIGSRMIQNGVQGDIINVGSMSADVREKNSSAYVGTKAGIQGFSEAFRKEINPHGVRVSLIEPGAVGTDMQPTSPAEERDMQKNEEMLLAEDIADAVLYILERPRRNNIAVLQIKPTKQYI
ncbi:SDR family oxidoreductase [Sphingobacterium deserti]|uniref:Short-chain dehydrogenase/reductase SDR n=1 Tax=Sphingobacterium deserti TaxID=1229276 RepID=A0A0B8T673_9SPHI|nr:SDR family oxidoreductase [Sphingobacterium deserti]KGE12570.1 short-chain dehydrogenase/reductase SDR [Sphingobacterium deserti]